MLHQSRDVSDFDFYDVQEGHASCIANEEGERQIACAISYNGEEVVCRHRLNSLR